MLLKESCPPSAEKKTEEAVSLNEGIVKSVPPSEKSDKDKWVALILLLIFGGLGVHYFYVGKKGNRNNYAIMYFGWPGINSSSNICRTMADSRFI